MSAQNMEEEGRVEVTGSNRLSSGKCLFRLEGTQLVFSRQAKVLQEVEVPASGSKASL